MYKVSEWLFLLYQSKQGNLLLPLVSLDSNIVHPPDSILVSNQGESKTVMTIVSLYCGCFFLKVDNDFLLKILLIFHIFINIY